MPLVDKRDWEAERSFDATLGRRLARRDQEPGPRRQPLLDRHHDRAVLGRAGQARSILRDLQRHHQVQGGRVGTTEQRGELQHARTAHNREHDLLGIIPPTSVPADLTWPLLSL